MQKNVDTSQNSKLYSKKNRLIIAKQIERVLQKHAGATMLKQAHVLDMGCSRGYITEFLSHFVGTIIGIDSDQEAIFFAKKNFKKSNLNFRNISAEKTVFPNESFDIVVCNQVYMYFKNPKKLFKEIHRVLKPGGICFLGAVNKYSRTAFTHAEYSYKSWWELRKDCLDFQITSYAGFVIKRKYAYLQWFPDWILYLLEPFLPNFLWILER